MGDPANFNLWGERSTPEYLLPKRGFDTCTRVVSAIESPHLFFLAPKQIIFRQKEYLEWVESIKSDEYYIRMMQAWFFATALAKQWDATLPYIEQHRLEKDTHNKTIQKAVESFRITDEQKALLKTLRVK